jgi:hypothetical protein
VSTTDGLWWAADLRETNTDPNLWMLDLEGLGWPRLAHLIVEEHDGMRTTACGRRVTAATHSRGWWSTRAGVLPLANPKAIHCGQDEMA